MPKMETHMYRLSGPGTQLIYSEQEMASALGMSVGEMRRHLEPHENGLSMDECIPLCYHAHPLATGGEFKFTQASYDQNVATMRKHS